MKIFPLKNLAAVALGVLALGRLGAAVESARIESTFVPSFNPVLLNRGVTEGKLALVIDISEDGKVTDWLVLGYTDPEMVGFFVDAIKVWDITPARIDGKPVASQMALNLSVSAEGVVVSRSLQENIEALVRRLSGNPINYLRSSARDLDRPLVRINGVAPKYAEQAEKEGVRGKVMVRFYIDEHGAVRMPSIEAGAHPYLAVQAVAAVREWTFEPPTSKGRPVLVAASQEFDFGGAK